MRAICSEAGCSEPVHARGLCSTHYERIRRREKAGGCRDCGGPKPEGIGRKLCDSCLEKANERARARQAEYQRQRYLANREKVLAETRARYQDPEFRERKRQAAREWAEKNPERVRANQRRA